MTYTIEETAEILCWYEGGNTPCDCKNLDDNADCDWCAEHCGQVDPIECWKHALREGWLD